MGAVVEGGVKRELVEVGGDEGAVLASTFLTAAAAAGVGKPLRLLTGATAEDVVVEARTFQILTAGGLSGAAGLGAGAGDGLTSSTFASSAGFSTAVSLARGSLGVTSSTAATPPFSCAGGVGCDVGSSGMGLTLVDEGAASAFFPLFPCGAPFPFSFEAPTFFSLDRWDLSPLSCVRRGLGPALSSFRLQSTDRLDALRDVVTVVKGCSSDSLADGTLPLGRCELVFAESFVVDVADEDFAPAAGRALADAGRVKAGVDLGTTGVGCCGGRFCLASEAQERALVGAAATAGVAGVEVGVGVPLTMTAADGGVGSAIVREGYD